MAQPGVKSPPNLVPKQSNGCSKLPMAAGSKDVDCQHLDFLQGQPTTVKSANGPVAPPDRIYTRDYSKVGRAPDPVDYITAALGRSPLRP